MFGGLQYLVEYVVWSTMTFGLNFVKLCQNLLNFSRKCTCTENILFVKKNQLQLYNIKCFII